MTLILIALLTINYEIVLIIQWRETWCASCHLIGMELINELNSTISTKFPHVVITWELISYLQYSITLLLALCSSHNGEYLDYYS